MVREIENIFTDLPGYGCFACDPRNDLGLRLRFYADDKKGEVFTTINPEKYLEGFPGILHGGIQCALLDEVAFWTMFDRFEKIGVTMGIDMDFLRPVGTSNTLEVRGKIHKTEGKKVSVDVNILDYEEKVCTKSRVVYYIAGRKMIFKIMGRERFTDKFLKYLGD